MDALKLVSFVKQVVEMFGLEYDDNY